MEDFNHIEHDPIPEGLEFNESYMQNAFALYDAEKHKRKRRILIWWITSAVGFASILLIGMYFFTRGELSDSLAKKASADKPALAQKDWIAEQKSEPEKQVHRQNTPAITVSKSTTKSNITFGKEYAGVTPGTSSGTHRTPINTKVTAASASRGKQHLELKAHGITKSVDTSDEEKNTTELSGMKTGTDQHSEISEAGRIPKVDSVVLFEAVNLPARAALLSTGDSIPTLSDEQLLTRTDEVPLRRHQVFMNLGVNTLFGMKELQHRATFRESIGVSYNYRINEKLAIGAGLEYHSISRISYKRIIGDTLNSDKTTTILNKTTLNYISFLPQVNYRLGTRHQLTAGFGIEYLLTDPGERYEIQNYTNEDPKRVNSKLYYSTFNRFNFSASLGYCYQFSPFMSVEASYHFGFTDITINNGFNNTFDRNSRLHLGLKIKLH